LAERFAEEADPTAERLINEAFSVNEEYRDILERKGAIRDSLRALAKSGVVSKEQASEIEDLFPPRQKKGSEPGEDEQGYTETEQDPALTEE
jgi:hypothetical protein